jgi:hypothetical protein
VNVGRGAFWAALGRPRLDRSSGVCKAARSVPQRFFERCLVKVEDSGCLKRRKREEKL